ncbi:metal-dependent hydrolase [Serinibacter arcticus]|uniref:Metal-dependent hydrolase n=1 Tax=Serinibacter arcticus TaxID=1655435 RepID=A0A2U1ZW02_9MICO|nr:metal-dependent hydrolase [Serinibacter arcticus]PWD51102.1 metal-dependent hydrolase [Serinibacter arcticus]
MTLPTTDTTVTYPDGATTSAGTVLHVEALPGGRSAVLLDTTAFHPVDTAWPDQPADRGTLTTPSTGTQAVVEAVTGGIADGRLLLGADLPVRTGTDGWVFVVAHILEGDVPTVGEEARIDVDPDLRRELSAGHTACHLAALALDAALAPAWTKEPPVDALGNPAFDALAIQRSRIEPLGSIDTYRIGKSLRRKGFSPDGLADLAAVADAVNARLAQWLDGGGAVSVERSDSALSARRTWVCELDDGRTDIPCGGTHVRDLAEIGAITCSLTRSQVDGGVEVVMRTVVTPA